MSEQKPDESYDEYLDRREAQRERLWMVVGLLGLCLVPVYWAWAAVVYYLRDEIHWIHSWNRGDWISAIIVLNILVFVTTVMLFTIWKLIKKAKS